MYSNLLQRIKHRKQKTEGDEIMVCKITVVCMSLGQRLCVIGCDENRCRGRGGIETEQDRDVDDTNDGGSSVT